MALKASEIALAGAVALALLAGCAKHDDESSSSTTTTTTVSSPAAVATSSNAMPAASAPAPAASPQGDPAKGRLIFEANCASCHGEGGQGGGIGPRLVDEKSRKNLAQTVSWIEDPQPPMPKLYPSPLSLPDVKNVAAYVQTL